MSGWVSAGSFLSDLDERFVDEDEAKHARRLKAIAEAVQRGEMLQSTDEEVRAYFAPAEDTPEIRARLMQSVREGKNFDDAASSVGWSSTTLARKQRRDPELHRQLRVARSEAPVRHRRHIRAAPGSPVSWTVACACGTKAQSRMPSYSASIRWFELHCGKGGE